MSRPARRAVAVERGGLTGARRLAEAGPTGKLMTPVLRTINDGSRAQGRSVTGSLPEGTALV